ncbi:hypothetical protein [Streptomyces sp. NPDC014995]|uniref:hypothetical protein n=1 Tax=Streptomyces sp. NPDC014995 TaxID=3364936 RepID=UPI0036FDDE29
MTDSLSRRPGGAGAAAPSSSSAVSPSATDSLLSTVASLLYGDRACTGGTASATRSRPKARLT